jgi:hypothetical protein
MNMADNEKLLTDGPAEWIATCREYRKIATILATQYNGQHVEGVCTGPHGSYDETSPHIHTLEGDLSVSIGDWIATGIQGERWAIKPDVFASTYVPVEPAAPVRPEDDEENECHRCHQLMHIREGCDPTKYCDSCAQDLVTYFESQPAAPVVQPIDEIGRQCLLEQDTFRLLTETSEDFADRMRRLVISERRKASRPTPVVEVVSFCNQLNAPVVVGPEDRELTIEEWRDECDKLTEFVKRLMEEKETRSSIPIAPVVVPEIEICLREDVDSNHICFNKKGHKGPCYETPVVVRPEETSIARQIVTRLVTNTLTSAHMRWLETLQLAEGEDPIDLQELIDDGLAVALGDDIGCLDEEQVTPEFIDLLFVESLLTAQPAPLPSDDAPCGLCGEDTDHWAGNPGKWPVKLPYKGGNGKIRIYHRSCVTKAIDKVQNPAPLPSDDGVEFALSLIQQWTYNVHPDQESDLNQAIKIITARAALPSGQPKPSIPDDALACRCAHESQSGVYTMAQELQQWRKYGAALPVGQETPQEAWDRAQIAVGEALAKMTGIKPRPELYTSAKLPYTPPLKVGQE